ncbi:MAG TPA: hypothetical protein VHW44_16125 [Pseudonocardiaceae bacterium]|nr:hypothetical protein [Pseudonocardiaceae bacterium]
MNGDSMAEFVERADRRVGEQRLPAHLEARYGIQVDRMTELDIGVFRIDRSDGPDWVARVFPASRPLAEVEGDARILKSLQRAGFPAEQCARPDPVSTHEGQGVLVTEFVPGDRPDGRGRTFAVLGARLGRLHSRSAADARPGGAWHHLAPSGGPTEEIAAAKALLATRPAADQPELAELLAGLDDCEDLPHSFVHPDFVPANAITAADGKLVIVDWAGAGRGPRLWSLGFLLWTAGARDLRLVDAVVSRYRAHIQLEPDELDRLAEAIRARPFLLDVWSFCMGRKRLPAVLADAEATNQLAEAIAERARQGFADEPDVRRLPAATEINPVTNPVSSLSTLLSAALVAYTVEFDNEFERRLPHRTTRHGGTTGPWLVSLVMWTSGMRFVTPAGVTVAELRRLARTGTNLAGLQRWGYLEIDPGPGRDRKRPGADAVLRPTRTGVRAQEVWRPLFGEIDTRWRQRFGAEKIDRLRAALTEIAGRLDFAAPDGLPILGYGLFSRGGGPDEDRFPPTEDALPPIEADLPLSALLSRVLLAFAVEFERGSPLSLAVAANVLRVTDTPGIRVRDLPGLTGVTKEALAMSLGYLEKHGYVAVGPVPAPGRGQQVRLTPAGQQTKAESARLVAAIEQRWSTRFGPETIQALRAVLNELAGDSTPTGSPLFAGLEPYPDGWRAEVRRPSTLPHYPMVLHRGGYPDGS